MCVCVCAIWSQPPLGQDQIFKSGPNYPPTHPRGQDQIFKSGFAYELQMFVQKTLMNLNLFMNCECL